MIEQLKGLAWEKHGKKFNFSIELSENDEYVQNYIPLNNH
jgi:hypothetical protein